LKKWWIRLPWSIQQLQPSKVAGLLLWRVCFLNFSAFYRAYPPHLVVAQFSLARTDELQNLGQTHFPPRLKYKPEARARGPGRPKKNPRLRVGLVITQRQNGRIRQLLNSL
jgi:hypothetical protein